MDTTFTKLFQPENTPSETVKKFSPLFALEKEIVRELIQKDLNEKNLVKELNALLPGGWKREIMIQNYSLLKKKLDGKGASARIADDIYHSLKIIRNVN